MAYRNIHCIVLLTMACIIDNAWAQNAPGSLSATVHGHVFLDDTNGSSKGLLKDAHIELLDANGILLGNRTTDLSGYYSFADVSPGELTAIVSAPGIAPIERKIRLAADRGGHVLDFILEVRTNDEASQPDLAEAEIGVFQEVPDGRSRRTNATVLLWRNDTRRVLETPDPISGNYEIQIEPGEWNVTATLPGELSSDASTLTVTAGERIDYEILIPSAASTPEISALIAVRKTNAETFKQPPVVSFVGAETVTARIEDAGQEASAVADSVSGDTTSWNWYWAYPNEELDPGEYRVTGQLAELQESTGAQYVSAKGAMFKLTFRPEDELGTVSGLVAAAGDGSPIQSANLRFSREDSIETRGLQTDDAGRYEIKLSEGTWWVTASAEDYDSVPAQQVAIVAAGSATRDFTLSGTETDGGEDQPGQPSLPRLTALVGIPKSVSAESLNVVFEDERGRTFPAVHRNRPESALAAGDSTEGDIWSWHAAAPEEPVEPGIYRAKVTVEQTSGTSEWKPAVDGEVAYHVILNPARTAARRQLTLNVQSDTGEWIPNAGVRLWSDESTAGLVTGTTDADGAMTRELDEGLWWASITASGYAEVKKAILVTAEATTQTIILESRNSLLSAVVAVERRWSQSTTQPPSVLFSASGNDIPARVQRLSGMDVGGVSTAQSAWDWFEAIPSRPILPGLLTVTTSQDGYITERQQESLGVDEQKTIHLTLRAEPAARMTLVTGSVYQMRTEPDGSTGSPAKKTLVPGHSIRFTLNNGGSGPVVVPADGGTYQAELASGGWSAELVDQENSVIAAKSLVCGAEPREEVDFEIPSSPGHSTVTALLKVVDADNLGTEPEATATITIDGNERTVPVTVHSAKPAAADGSRWFRIGPTEPLPPGSFCRLQASAGERYHSVESERVQVVKPTLLNLTMAPVWRTPPPSEPGRLAGCVYAASLTGEEETRTREVTYVVNVQETRTRTVKGPDGKPVEQTYTVTVPHQETRTENYTVQMQERFPVPNARIILRHVKTRQIVKAVTDREGCYTVSLDPGSWRLAVLAAEYAPYQDPEEVTISINTESQRDITLPLPPQPEPTPSEVVVAVAIPSDTGLPEELRIDLQRAGPMPVGGEGAGGGVGAEGLTETVSSCVGVEMTSTQLDRYVPAANREGWKWYIGIFNEPLTPGMLVASATSPGFEHIGELPRRIVSPGFSAVFDLRMKPLLPQINVLVQGSGGEPEPNVNVRFIHSEKQKYKDATVLTTDDEGRAETMLTAGTGIYNILLTGEGIESQGQTIEIRERFSEHRFEIFREGETKKFAFSGIVLAAPPKEEVRYYFEQPESVPARTRRGFARRPLPAFLAAPEDPQPIAGAEVRLESLADHALPAELLRPRPTNDQGEFKYESVPEGEYRLVVTAQSFRPYLQSVTISNTTEGLRILMQARNVELEDAIRLLLTDGWGQSEQQRQAADEAYQKGLRKDPRSVALQYARALAWFNAREKITANQMLAELHQATDSSDVIWRDRGLELSLWLDLLLRRDVSAGIRAMVDEYAEAVGRMEAGKTAFVMGIGTGMTRVGTDRVSLEGIEDELGAELQTDFVRGRDLVMNQFDEQKTKNDDDAEAKAARYEVEKEAELARLAKLLAETIRLLAELEQRHNEEKEKVRTRLAEIDAELRREFDSQQQQNARINGISEQIRRVKTELQNLLNDARRGGGFIDRGQNRNTVRVEGTQQIRTRTRRRDHILTGFQELPPNVAERERQLRARLLNLDALLRRATGRGAKIAAGIRELQETRQRIEAAWNQSFGTLDAEYRKLEAQRDSTKRRIDNLKNGVPDYERENSRAERKLRNATSYWQYPIEERRRELLQAVSTPGE